MSTHLPQAQINQKNSRSGPIELSLHDIGGTISEQNRTNQIINKQLEHKKLDKSRSEKTAVAKSSTVAAKNRAATQLQGIAKSLPAEKMLSDTTMNEESLKKLIGPDFQSKSRISHQSRTNKTTEEKFKVWNHKDY